METAATLVGTIFGTILVSKFDKHIAELMSQVNVTFLQKDKLESVSKSITSVVKKDVEKEVEKDVGNGEWPMFKLAPPKKSRNVGDYVDSSWNDGDVPQKAINAMESVLDMNLSEETAQKMTNTCKKLLEYYAMKAERRKQLEKIRDAILISYSDMAHEIDMSLFSQCAWFEGKIALYR